MDAISEALSYCPLTSEFHCIHNVDLLTANLNYIFIILPNEVTFHYNNTILLRSHAAAHRHRPK